MIVNKPQFDVENIKVGQAYWLKKVNYKRMTDYAEPCLISFVSPLKISVVLFKEEGRSIEKCLSHIDIAIREVVDGTFDLIPMHKEEKK